jgi:two-component system nitrogen regulation response regulator GlnG
MDKKPLIFVVDDDQSLLYSMSRFLSRYDVEVKTLSNGFEVLLMCMYMVPDLIISDIRMPKLDGVTLLQGLKNNEATREVPVIFMSAYPSDRILEEAKELGAKYFLIKPFPLEYIEELIPRALPHLRLREPSPAKAAGE